MTLVPGLKGLDYYIYCCDPTNGSDTVDRDEVFVISKNSTYPSGYTADNSRKIGGFHYGKCRYVNALGNPINSSGTENGSGWQGNVYNGIIPNSVWHHKAPPEVRRSFRHGLPWEWIVGRYLPFFRQWKSGPAVEV